MEEVREFPTVHFFFQLYVLKDRSDRGFGEARRNAGYAAIIVTVDEPATRSGERDGASNALRESRQPKGSVAHADDAIGNLRGTGINSERTCLMRWRLDSTRPSSIGFAALRICR